MAAALLVLIVNIKAQGKAKLKFSSINQLGLLIGSSDHAFQIQTINGLSYQTWFAGVGLGLDGYRERSIPLFADFRKAVFQKQESPFIYMDLGASLPWRKEEKAEWQTSTWRSGWFYEAGIGYTFPVKGSLVLNVTGGYSLKALHETRTATGVIIDFPPYDRESPKEYYDYTYRRFSLKLGLRF